MTDQPHGLVRDRVREDGPKLRAIMEFLSSRGLLKSLAQLEAETEVQFDGVFGEALVDNLMDKHLMGLHAVEDLPNISPPHEFPFPGECATDIHLVSEVCHGTANPTSVVWHPTDQKVLLTGGADGRVLMWNLLELNVLLEATVPSPVLFLDWSISGFIAVACMGGELEVHRLVDGELQVVLSEKPLDTNRMNSTKFSPDGLFLVASGKHTTAAIYECSGDRWLLRKGIRCSREVASVAWVDEYTLLIAESGNCMIQVHRLDTGHFRTIGQICMNLSLRDPRTEYSSLAMSVDPTRRFLVACTSRNSALLFKLPENWATDTVCVPDKVLYGMSVGIYDVPSACFSRDSSFVYVTSDKEIMVFETRTGCRAFNLEVSPSKPIRCMSRHMAIDTLAMVSFDKHLRLLL